jgi:hypothetical protein
LIPPPPPRKSLPYNVLRSYKVGANRIVDTALVRALTARLFTREEQGHQHCQIGNLGLQHRVIKDWLGIMQEQEGAAK